MPESASGEVPAPRGVSASGGGSGPGGGDVPACTEADTPPPVNRMNDRQV